MTDGKTPIDIESLVTWAIAQQSGMLPWHGCSDDELAFNHGYTAIPKGYHGVFTGGGTALRRPIGHDAGLVIAAIMELPAATAEMVIANARGGTRPQWEVASRRLPIFKRHKRRHRMIVTGYRKIPASEAAICAARGAYRAWHDGLAVLAGRLQGKLNSYEITGLRAAMEPWSEAAQKAA